MAGCKRCVLHVKARKKERGKERKREREIERKRDQNKFVPFFKSVTMGLLCAVDPQFSNLFLSYQLSYKSHMKKVTKLSILS